LQLRVGRIVDVKRHPEAEKLYVESIDLGADVNGGKPVTVVSGLVDYIPIDRMRVR
jgi:tRNA-binding EMAP/Myf-like protein